jgi:nicotinamide riboside transporter PnuC
MWLEAAGWSATLVVLAGAWLNARGARACFVCWVAGNALAPGLHLATGFWAFGIRDAVFLAMAVQGWRSWSRMKGKAVEG